MPLHAFLKCDDITQGCATDSQVKQPFPSQAILNKTVESQLWQAVLPPATPQCLTLGGLLPPPSIASPALVQMVQSLGAQIYLKRVFRGGREFSKHSKLLLV